MQSDVTAHMLQRLSFSPTVSKLNVSATEKSSLKCEMRIRNELYFAFSDSVQCSCVYVRQPAANFLNPAPPNPFKGMQTNVNQTF